MAFCLSGVRCRGIRGREIKNAPFSPECPLTKNRIWTEAVNLEDKQVEVLDGWVCADGHFGQQLLQLANGRRPNSLPTMNFTSLEALVAQAGEEPPSPSTPAAPRDCWEPAVNKDFDEAVDFAPSDSEEPLRRLMELFHSQRALVKTCKNDGWEELFDKLSGPRSKTPLTLVPKGGQGMRLFCETRRAACGLVWNVDDLDLSDAYMWPSGYFAKTEFNVGNDGRLKQGRESFLVTLEQLREANDRREFLDQLTGKVVSGDIMPYNEVLAGIGGTVGLVGVMARTTQIKHLLLAMGVRDHLAKLLPNLGALPIVLHDPELGARPFPVAAQLEVVRRMLAAETSYPLRYPLDLHLLAENGAGIAALDQLRFHGRFGITKEALMRVAEAVSGEVPNGQLASPGTLARRRRFAESAAFALLALEYAVAADNAASTKAAVRVILPLIYHQDNLSDRSFVSAGRRDSDSTDEPDDSIDDGDEDGDELGCRQPRMRMVSSSITLRNMMARADSRDVRAAIGACLALESFHSGRSSRKIEKGIVLFQEWLREASSLRFRLKSHSEEKRSWAELGDFASDRICENRRLFLATLRELQACTDRVAFFRSIKELVALLLHPCLRLQVLQSILGLDQTYNREMVADVVNLVFDIISDMDAPSTL